MATRPAIVPNQLLPLRVGGRTHHPITDCVDKIRTIHRQFMAEHQPNEAHRELLDQIDEECDAIIDELDILAAHNIFGTRP